MRDTHLSQNNGDSGGRPGKTSVFPRFVSPISLLRWLADPRSTHRVFDFVARGYDIITGQKHWRASAARLLRWLPASASPRVLDLGAGPGNSGLAMLDERPDARIVLLDRAPAMVQRAQRLTRHSPRLSSLLADAACLPFRAGWFDLVTGHSFLYLLPDHPTVLREAYRVARPGGYVAFMEPAADPLSPHQWLRLTRGGLRFFISMLGWRLVSGIHRRFNPATLMRALQHAGFHPVHTEPTLEGAGVIGAGQRPIE